MSTNPPNISLPEYLKLLVAIGDVHPGDGSRLLPVPIEPAAGAKTAADYVVEGRR